MKIKNIFYSSLITFILSMHVMVNGQSQSAHAGFFQAEGTDFILLIDESGSMCGSSVHSGRNDPDNKRNEFIKLILPDLLKSQDRGLRHRLTVIEFGSRHGASPQWQVLVSLSAFQFPVREMDEEDQRYIPRVLGCLKELTHDRNRGNTDHGAALKLALTEMQKFDQIQVPVPLGQTGVEERLKVVVLITDGKPFLPNMTEAEQLQEIREVVNHFPHENAILFVLGLNADSDYWFAGKFGDFWKNMALQTKDNKDHVGDALFIKDHKDIYVTIEPLLRQYIYNENSGGCCLDRYECPPYLKSVEFTIEYSTSYMRLQDALRIIDPNGDSVPYHYFETDKTFAKLKIEYPLQGIWKFEINKDIPCKIIWKEERGVARYVNPLPPFPVGSSNRIQFQVEGKKNDPIFLPLKQFPLDAYIYIKTPSNIEEVLNAEALDGIPGGFVSVHSYQFGEPGIYHIQFTGKTISASGEPKTVILSPLKKVTVKDSRPVSLHLNRPLSFGSILGGVEEDAVISFQSQGEDIPVQEILENRPSITGDIEFFAPKGKIAESFQIPFRYQSGDLIGHIGFNIHWQFLPEFLRGDVKGKLILNMDNKILKQKYFLKDPGTQSQLYEFIVPVSVSFLTYGFVLLAVFIPGALIFYFAFYKKRAESMSKDIPMLVYRHGNKFEPDQSVFKSLEIFKRKMIFNQKVRTPFDIPGIPDQWEPLLTVIRHRVPRGVKVTVVYEKYKANKKDKQRFQEVHLETLDNKEPAQCKIVGLEMYEMIFELKIKEKDQ